MSKYTTELRFICEHLAGMEESVGFEDVNNIILVARPKIFSFSYPIFDPQYRSVLETKIIRHYYTREICAETYSLWKLWLQARMNEIMPYYNKLYESELLEFNPLNDVNLTVDHSKDTEGTNENTDTARGTRADTKTLERETTSSEDLTRNLDRDISESGTFNGNHWDYYNDTPQGGITGLNDLDYLTNARHITDSNTSTHTTAQEDEVTQAVTGSGTQEDSESLSSTTTNNITRNGEYTDSETYLQHIVGKRGYATYSKMLQEYRETFLNIDKTIIDELADLFFNLW